MVRKEGGALGLKGTGIAVTTPLQVTVAALILGKAVLIADHLPWINRYPDKPLAYNQGCNGRLCMDRRDEERTTCTPDILSLW